MYSISFNPSFSQEQNGDGDNDDDSILILSGRI
jgi:hypothetical protein